MPVNVRPLRRSDVPASSRMHSEVLDMEFLAQCGDRFLRCYHQAWLDTAHCLALAAVDDDGEVTGVLLGALRPASHYRAMVKKHGVALTLCLISRSVTHPRLAKDLLTTRLVRYVHGLSKMVLSAADRAFAGLRPRSGRHRVAKADPVGSSTIGDSPEQAPSLLVGEVTHVMVSPKSQGTGVGRALLEEARRVAELSGLDELVLVTPPGLAASGLYEHLGWHRTGDLTSRSGEEFVGYRLLLRPRNPPPLTWA